MQEGKIMHFKSITDLQSHVTKDLEELKKKFNEHSELVGNKLREGTGDNSEELAELKEKLEGPSDPKKKKPVKKKDQKTNWNNIDSVSVYDGMGLKGELELYFKSLETMKLKIDKMQKIIESLDGLVTKGIKKDLGCVVLLNNDLSFDIVFMKTNAPKVKFSYKAIMNIGAE